MEGLYFEFFFRAHTRCVCMSGPKTSGEGRGIKEGLMEGNLMILR